MRNPYRYWTLEEFDTLRSGLKANLRLLQISKETPLPITVEGSLLAKLVPAKEVMAAFYENEEIKTKFLLEKLNDLFNHDINWLDEGTPKWCLGCKRRHEPHCANCQACLPDKLAE